MGLETASTIWGLNTANPAGTDSRPEGDDHIRLIKSALQGTFLEPDTLANRPAAGTANRIYIATDENKIYFDDGASWVDLTPKEPVGTLHPYAGTSAPSGYLLCDGSAVSRTTYADLFAILSTTFGAGDGSTTFNVPDLRGRGVVGLDNMGGSSADRVTATEADSLGGTEGAETHALTEAEGPSHTHSGTTSSGGAHSHTVESYNAGSDESSNKITWDDPHGAFDIDFSTSSAGNHNHSFTTGSSGSGDAHNNMPPYMALGYIIKT